MHNLSRFAMGLALVCLSPLPRAIPGEPIFHQLEEPFSRDVSLRDTILTGRYVTLSGAGISEVKATVKQAGHEIASTITDMHGNFVIPGLRTGVYELVLGNRSEFVRLWDAEAAPPMAFPLIKFTRDGKLQGNGGKLNALKLMGAGGNPLDVLDGLFGNETTLKELPLITPIIP